MTKWRIGWNPSSNRDASATVLLHCPEHSHSRKCAQEGRLSHPNVIAHTNATNAGNKHSFSVAQVDNMNMTCQKKQHDMGRYEAMIYFKKEVKMNKLTWLVLIFDDVKGGWGGKSATARQCCIILRINDSREGDFGV